MRGLCERCNNFIGAHGDAAYADLANHLTVWNRVRESSRLSLAVGVPAIELAPGLVARSILYGLHALSPQLRVLFPTLAAALAAGDDEIRLPPGLQLRVARYEDTDGYLSGPVHAYRVLSMAEVYQVFAEVYFPPLAWVLAPVADGLVFDTHGWARADEWLRYSSQRTSVDLRWLTGRFPLVRHVMRTSDDWVEMFSDEITPFLQAQVR